MVESESARCFALKWPRIINKIAINKFKKCCFFYKFSGYSPSFSERNVLCRFSIRCVRSFREKFSKNRIFQFLNFGKFLRIAKGHFSQKMTENSLLEIYETKMHHFFNLFITILLINTTLEHNTLQIRI